jgi:hypothetical protein
MDRLELKENKAGGGVGSPLVCVVCAQTQSILARPAAATRHKYEGRRHGWVSRVVCGSEGKCRQPHERSMEPQPGSGMSIDRSIDRLIRASCEAPFRAPKKSAAY